MVKEVGLVIELLCPDQRIAWTGSAIDREPYLIPLVADGALTGRVDTDSEGCVAAFLNGDIVWPGNVQRGFLRIKAETEVGCRDKLVDTAWRGPFKFQIVAAGAFLE